MSDKTKHKVIHAALAVFVRYGYQKATMQDIAKEAQVARQSLYNLFPNKMAILTATMIFFIDETYQQILSNLKVDMPIDEKLHIIGEYYVYEAFKIVSETADNGAGYPVSEEIDVYLKEKYISLVASFIEPYAKKLQDKNIDPQAYAELIFLSLQSAKTFAKNFEHLKVVLDMQIKNFTFYLTH